MDAVCNHFSAKFTMISNGRNNDTIRAANKRVKQKYNSVCTNINDPEVVISEYQIRRYIKQLKCGTSQHLKCAVNTNLPTYLSVLLTLCVRFGLVPDTFRTRVLVPLVKKPNLDPCDAASYRPFNISVTFSILLEYYILEEMSKEYQPSEYQFGFIPDRSTQMATSLI